MNHTKQWSIRQLLLWVTVVALVCSHLAGYYQRRIVGFTNFAVDGNYIMQWVVDGDPTADSYGSAAGTSTSPDACEYEFDMHVSTNNLDSNEVLHEIRGRFESKAGAERWSILSSGGNGESFDLALSKGVTRFRVYGWVLPVTESSLGNRLEANGSHITRLKLLQVGYSMP